MATFYSGQKDYIEKLNALSPELVPLSLVIEGSSVAGVATVASSNHYYNKVGNSVHFNIEATITAHTGSGNVVVKGLPFSSAEKIVFHPTIISAVGAEQNTVGCLYAGGTEIKTGLVMPIQEFSIKLTGRYTST